MSLALPPVLIWRPVLLGGSFYHHQSPRLVNYTVILSSYLTRSNLSYNHLFLELNPLPDIRTLELILTALLKALSSIICVRYLAARGGE